MRNRLITIGIMISLLTMPLTTYAASIDLGTILQVNETAIDQVYLDKYAKDGYKYAISLQGEDAINFYSKLREIEVTQNVMPAEQEVPEEPIMITIMDASNIYTYEGAYGFKIKDKDSDTSIRMRYSLDLEKLSLLIDNFNLEWKGLPKPATSLPFYESYSYCKFTVGDNTFRLDGKTKPIDSNPLVVPYIDEASERTMIPIRALAEALGYEVGWDEAEERVTLNNGLLEAELKIGSSEARVKLDKQYEGNWEKTINLDALPVTVNDRTFVPVRFLSEALGYSVVWDSIRGKVYIDPIADQEVLDSYPYLEFSDDGTAEVGMRTYNNGQIPRIWHFPDGTPLYAEIYTYDGQKVLSLPDSTPAATPNKVFYPDSDNADSCQFSMQGLTSGLYYTDVWYTNKPNEIYRMFFEAE